MNKAIMEMYYYYKTCNRIPMPQDTFQILYEVRNCEPAMSYQMKFHKDQPRDAWNTELIMKVKDGLPLIVSLGSDGQLGAKTRVPAANGIHGCQFLARQNHLQYVILDEHFKPKMCGENDFERNFIQEIKTFVLGLLPFPYRHMRNSKHLS